MMEFDMFSKWLQTYLKSLTSDIDAETYGDYIDGMLRDDTMDPKEITESISGLLESVVPPEDAIRCSQEIYSRFQDQYVKSEKETVHTSIKEKDDSSSLDILEETMRSMLAASKDQQAPQSLPETSSKSKGPKLKELDPITVSMLRAAGVSGYQGDEQAEAELTIKLVNADYVARQALGQPSAVGLDFDADEPEAEDIDLTELEAAQGYGKKDGIQPGNIMDALATLNPNKFGSAETAKAPPDEKLKAIRQLKRLPTPGDVNSSTTPAYMLLNTRGINVGLTGLQNSATDILNDPSTSSNGGGTLGISASGKKKSAPPPKKLADIGARAEEKHQKMMAKRKERMNLLGAAGSRLDDLDAFLFSDDDDSVSEKLKKHEKRDDILDAGGGNREKVVEAQKQARVISGKEFAERRVREKIQREKQLEAEAKRRTSAQQKAQKVERRRH
ncbi:unnamed protein product [Hymenolepis diminuta]|uniref:Coiled-coil domain-containing protein 43 n=1 Tax=Hymenolepis diminuta TaxID=6216 RepID=A0A0R3SGL0_HYMDI|nr:unnamed protein product [Hymenolepis diminuta]VUZ39779.1 unnamed protein product [Hymenolepis diminuta]